LVPTVSDEVLKRAVTKEIQRLGAQALLEAAKLGQKGALLEIRVAKATVSEVTHRSLVGSGVRIVGVGPTPAGVLYSTELTGSIGAAIPSGMALDSETSHFLWLEQPKGQESALLDVSRYEIAELHSYTQLARASDSSRRALEKATAATYLQGYGQMLAETAQSAQEQKVIEALLKSREAATASLSRIEQELTVRLDQQAKAARAAATWQTISTIFSIGANVAMASSAVGADLKNPDGSVPKTGAELGASIARLSAERTKQVEVLSDQARGLKSEMEAINSHILNHGVQRGAAMPGDVQRLLFQLD
jgi:hypothetical protein